MANITRDDLTHEFVRETFDYLPIGRLASKKTTRGKKAGHIVGCFNMTSKYRQVAVGDKLTVLEHRLIFFWHHGFWPKQVDHINGIKFDNRIENLREACPSTNQMNVGVRTFTKSGLKGVHWDQSRQSWMARIKVNGKHKFLGRFQTKEEAYEARKQAQHFHGDFARL